MEQILRTAVFDAPPVDRRAVLRYAQCAKGSENVSALLESALEEALPCLSYRLCWREFACALRGGRCELGPISVDSRALETVLLGCGRVLVFAATVGLELDRLIAKYGTLSPARALMMQAIGAERIEALCDAFCAERAAVAPLTARFSPGYGDLPLAFQRDLFAVLDCPRSIGLTLNGSLSMSPSKSVTAVAGIRTK